MSLKNDRPERQSILIVDDEKGIRDLFQRILRWEGYHVDVADSGADAVGLAEKRHYNLVLMDLGMPEMKGPEAIRRITCISPGTQFLVLTGHLVPRKCRGSAGIPDELDRLVMEGHYNCVFKPFKNEDMIAKIKTLLKPRRQKSLTAVAERATG